MSTKKSMGSWLVFWGSVCLAAGCSSGDKPAGVSGEEAAVKAPVVVATYSGKSITEEQLDKTIQRELEKLEKKRYDLRLQAIQKMVVEDLIETQVADRFLRSGQVVVDNYVDENMVSPARAEIEAFFTQSIQPMATEAVFDDFHDRISDYLSGEARKKAMREYFLLLQRESRLEILLEEPKRARVKLDAVGAAKGAERPLVTVVEFGDFQCPFCARLRPRLDALVRAFPDKVRVVFKHFPVPANIDARGAAEAALCAEDQGKFWDYHDRLFDNQSRLEFEDLERYAELAKLDGDDFIQCLTTKKQRPALKRDLQVGEDVGVAGTPAVYVNGLLLDAVDLESLKAAVEAELALLASPEP